MTTIGRFGLTPRGVWMLAALTCAAGVVAAVFWPRDPLPGPRSVKAQEAAWSVPAPLRVDSDQALSTINGRPLWTLAAPGTPGAAPTRPDEPPLTPPDWRIVGTVIDGAQRLVLVGTVPAAPVQPAGSMVICVLRRLRPYDRVKLRRAPTVQSRSDISLLRRAPRAARW